MAYDVLDFKVEHALKSSGAENVLGTKNSWGWEEATVQSDFVWIPRFKTTGFDAGMIAKGFANDVELGGFGLAKYPMTHPLATMSTKGGNDGANWGSTYAAMSLAMKCAWTYVSWDEAILACEAMNLSGDIASSTGTSNGADGNSIIDTAFKTKITGNNLEIARAEGASTTTYYRRIKKVENHNNKIIFTPSLPYGLITALAGDNNDLRFTRKNSSTNYVNIVYANGGASGAMAAVRSGAGSVGTPYVITVTFYNDDNLASAAITAIRADANSHAVVHVENAPGNSGAVAIVVMGAASLAQFNTISGDAYTTKKFTLWGPYERATMIYLEAMEYIGAGAYSKGNNDYGKDVGDADEFQYYGRLDPDHDDGSHAICKVLTGTGPLSWRHNGKPSGVWGLNGNMWNWCKAKIGGAGENHIIDAGFMGEGLALPAGNNYLAGLATAGDSGVPDLALPGSVGSSDADFGGDYYYQNTGARAFRTGGLWDRAAYAGVFLLNVYGAPSNRDVNISFRAVL